MLDKGKISRNSETDRYIQLANDFLVLAEKELSQSATVEQRNDDANYRHNGQYSDNDRAVAALYIWIEIANLPPDLLVRKALFVRRFFMLNIFPHVESPRPTLQGSTIRRAVRSAG